MKDIGASGMSPLKDKAWQAQAGYIKRGWQRRSADLILK